MIDIRLNWRLLLALLAISIVFGTVFYSRFLAGKIASEERQKVEQWIAASKAVLNNPEMDLTLPNLIRNEQHDIPIIETNEKDSIISFLNLDPAKVAKDHFYLQSKLKEFKAQNSPLEIKFSDNPFIANRYYYGHTVLLDQVRYYPLLQLAIVAVFIFFIIYSITVSNKATQNQVWAGMAKETAHQLGTPISSLQGWAEMLRENPANDAITAELQKDINRLQLVSDRFSKIGSIPHLEDSDLLAQTTSMVEYIRKRTSDKVHISLDAHGSSEIHAAISRPLFDWVIENLLKNALDAMEGKGNILIDIRQVDKQILMDISDTGKGIPAANFRKVFNPGFTTKKRGWGLGLSLCKRIIEQYHKGALYVKQSELGRGTTFRIILNK